MMSREIVVPQLRAVGYIVEKWSNAINGMVDEHGAEHGPIIDPQQPDQNPQLYNQMVGELAYAHQMLEAMTGILEAGMVR